ncbi:MAG: hypothetical protein EA366_10265 [Spirulina sp. DLM2.Bin59]|nr:MAG: hypothetical protein EA366_10265 [Spirulina sp. DLM2.Bin59]
MEGSRAALLANLRLFEPSLCCGQISKIATSFKAIPGSVNLLLKERNVSQTFLKKFNKIARHSADCSSITKI